MKLAGLAVQSLLIGVYVALVLAMFYLLRSRERPEGRGAWSTNVGSKPSVAAKLLFAAFVHWICIVTRAFEAFVYWNGGLHADNYYTTMVSASSVAGAAFHGATVAVADSIVIGRLCIVSNYRRTVIVPPLVLLTAFLVTLVGHVYTYSMRGNLMDGPFKAMRLWRLSCSIINVCNNVYCTVMIVWLIRRTHVLASKNGSVCQSIQSTMILIIESAAFLTSMVIVSQVTYATGHVSDYFIIDCIPSIAALAAVLVHARTVIERGRKG
ncbi:hypothetical protein HDZ31DRAFT_45929 [Schizophyllum fasciatum]